MPLEIGQIVDNRYRVVKLLGRGGMGAVYRAWDMRLNTPVALKEMTPQPGLSAEVLEGLGQQFQEEARVLATFAHPHLVRVTDYFMWEESQYLVMDFVEGESLGQRIARLGAQSEELVVQWAVQLLGALTYCHKRGILHRDIKPHNIIITPDEDAVLVDFGLVKLWDPADPYTKTVMRGAGTPEYAPPEQYDTGTGHTDARSDIYSLGATLYHALTGQAPPSATQRIANPASFTPPRQIKGTVSDDVETAILKAMSVSMSSRFQTAEQFALALRPPWPGFSTSAPAQPRPEPASPRREQTAVAPGPPRAVAPTPISPMPVYPDAASPPVSRRRAPWVWIVAGLFMCGLVGVGGGGLLYLLGQVTPTPMPPNGDVAQITETPTATPMGAPTEIALNADGTGEYADLPAAVAAIAPGGTIRLAAGDYVLARPLDIDKPLTLVGAGMELTEIRSAASGYVVSYEGTGRFAADGITFRHTGDQPADVVWIVDGEVRFTRCRFTGAVWADDVAVRAGLRMSGSTTGRVEQCEATGNDVNGFRLEDNANVTLRNNIAAENVEIGINFRDSSQGSAEGNTCRNNGLAGLGASGNATPTFVDNIITDNDQLGIGYWGSATGIARGNRVTGSGLHGIAVNDNAAPLIESNIVTDNEQDGLIYRDNAGGEARENEFLRNGLHGIDVTDDANVTLVGNTSANNGQVGIRLSGNSTGSVRENEIIENSLSGIIIRNDATPTVESNTVQGSEQSGIVYFGNAGGILRYNQSMENGYHGIGLYDNANPIVMGNICSDNEQVGMRFSGEVIAVATDNECTGNGLSGISVRESAQPTLENNVSNYNTNSGISFYGNAGGVVRGNTFLGNGSHGIHVTDEAAPLLEANTCTVNVEAGIAYFGSSGGQAIDNVLVENRWGIYIAADANPTLGNNTFSNNVTDLDDRR